MWKKLGINQAQLIHPHVFHGSRHRTNVAGCEVSISTTLKLDSKSATRL